ncbi:LPS-assembly protein LptD [Limnoglobus roseus]|uniref:LPS-assembly protein LptD n=1 Tax=Limnoglobus roseus TaxID=2598579 RepID=A0A5C1AEP4_9BACT|nr:hypothetical protein [Limnoglobus roseus]QEL17230.1 LPS-assembly protein LptD [Limnoglobus roseus]
MACRTAFILLLLSATCGVAPRGAAQDLPQFPTLPLNTPRPTPHVAFQVPPPTLPADPPTVAPNPALPPPPPVTIPLPRDEVFLTEGSRVNLPANAKRQVIRYSPRYGNLNKFDLERMPDGTQRLVYTSGLIINVYYEIETGPKAIPQEYEFAADNIVMWIKNLNGRDISGGLPIDQEQSGDNRLEIELYMTGNVVIRSKDERILNVGWDERVIDTRVVRAEQIYYDVNKNRAVALNADLEMGFNKLQDTVHLRAERMERLGRSEWHATRAGAFSSKLPSDPALELLTSEASIVERETVRRNIFGLPYRNLPSGDLDYSFERTLTARNARVEILGVPIFYTPYVQTDPSKPLGPLLGIGFGNGRIFGTQYYTTWDMFNLLALRPPPGHNWRLNLDYLDKRGPGFGTDYSYTNPDFFGLFGKNNGSVRLYGIQDRGEDILGGYRGIEPVQSLLFDDPARNGRTFFRGRAVWQNQQELLATRDQDNLLTSDSYLIAQSQFAHQSDKNFYEQYFRTEFLNSVNQETFAYLGGSTGRFHGSLLVQDGQDRNWMTETRWLPEAKGALIGQSFFDIFTYNSRADLGYANFRPSQVYPPPVLSTEQKAINTGRADWWHELSVPLAAGPVKVVPYGVFDLTGYTEDLNGNSRGRVYGGGGARASVTFTRLFSDANSELFNVRGLNHKATLHSNYYYARTNVHYTDLPQLDRLDDDSIDQTVRTIKPFQTQFVKGADGIALATAPFFDPQQLAIRRLVDNRIDTRDDMQVVQLGFDQRLQTKRGFPGMEHTIDWLTLDLSTSLFPQASKDNYGKTAAFFEYNTLWNVGDQTAVSSSGWFDPFASGARYWNSGVYFNRPDRTSFYFGYRETNPVNSKAVIASIGYQLTKKYNVNLSTNYDFGIQQALSNTMLVTRTGTDLTVSIGLTYNQQTNNTGFMFVVVPNIAAGTALSRIGTAQFGGAR